ncbi:MAG: DUF3626 domain-containing protein [Candidatus Vogelbacteria bacterium]|nr:DUF3626 domain-containing protein [Candidatus Vogelbacteria bacterium]
MAKEKLAQARLVANLNLHKHFRNEAAIDSILRIGRLLTGFEAEEFPDGIYSQKFRGRLLKEFKLYGATRKLEIVMSHLLDSERPIYGSLDYLGGRYSLSSLVHYGRHRLVLKDGAKRRATFTAFDSSMVERDEVYVWENIEGVLAARLDGKFWVEYVLAGTEPLSTHEGVHYIEAQILGGVELDEIEKPYYPAAESANRAFFDKLQKLELDHRIELVQY